jgi:alanine dehydrogenase
VRIGVPRERKVMEFRVGMVPDGVRHLLQYANLLERLEG